MINRPFSNGEKSILVVALANEASRCQLQGLNLDLIRERETESHDSESYERLKQAAIHMDERRRLLETFAALVMSDHIKISAMIEVPDLTCIKN